MCIVMCMRTNIVIDEALMAEIRDLHAALHPVETLFVVDAMQGQDAVNTAKAFKEALPLTGIVLTKLDGDSRGGAALSVRHITQKPIKFVGVSEKMDGLQAFHPNRMAERILGMGDVLSLIEEAERKLDKQKAEQLSKKLQKGKGFDLEDFRDQLQQMQNMGGMAGLLDPLSKEVIIGSAEVRQVFELSKGTPVGGSMVTTGRIVRGKVRVRRRKDVIYEGVTQSLRRFQDEVNGETV